MRYHNISPYDYDHLELIEKYIRLHHEEKDPETQGLLTEDLYDFLAVLGEAWDRKDAEEVANATAAGSVSSLTANQTGILVILIFGSKNKADHLYVTIEPVKGPYAVINTLTSGTKINKLFLSKDDANQYLFQVRLKLATPHNSSTDDPYGLLNP